MHFYVGTLPENLYQGLSEQEDSYLTKKLLKRNPITYSTENKNKSFFNELI